MTSSPTSAQPRVEEELDGTIAPPPPQPSPTKAGDYAALNAVFGGLLTGLVVRGRGRAEHDLPIPVQEIPLMSAATFALAKVIARERIGTWMREPFVEDDRAGTKHRRPRGTGIRHAVGELVTCTRCVGAWSALGVVGLRTLSPGAGRIVVTVLATSAGNDVLQAGFRLLTETVNRAGESS